MDTRITDIYDAANGELLILGAPGSGKTTLLLELTRDLLERAEHDELHLMPVVFTLSSWAAKQPSLSLWMIEELTNKYHVPRKLALAWVETDQILPLLDGLDEVAAEIRTKCIETINMYHQEHTFLPLVVTSRSADYLAQTARVRLTSAVTIQSLTQQQVDDYLARGEEALWALRVALHQDIALRELAETPLMLSILTLTYHDMPVEDLLRGGIAPTRQQIFERYVERMLVSRGGKVQYTSEQTTHWLSWLARQMKQQSQTVFYIEHLQPDWLAGARGLRAYNRWAVRFPDIIMGMLVCLAISTPFNLLFSFGVRGALLLPIENILQCSLLGGLLGGLLSRGNVVQHVEVAEGKTQRAFWRSVFRLLGSGGLIGLFSGLLGGLSFGLLSGLSSGLSYGLSSILLQAILKNGNKTSSDFRVPKSSPETKWRHLTESAWLRNGILVGLSFGLSFGLISGLIVGLLSGLIVGLSLGLYVGLNFGLIFGISSAFLSILPTRKSVGIFLVDKLVWTWKSLGGSLFSKRHVNKTLRVLMFMGLIFGLIFGLIGELIFGLIGGLIFGLSNGLTFGLSNGLTFGQSYWLVLGLSLGISSEIIEDQHRVVPNEGIRRSARNSLLLGLITIGILPPATTLIVGLSLVLISKLISGVSSGLSSELIIVLISGVISGVSFGLLVGLLNGGLAWLRHSVLRRLLRRAGSIPRNYPHFLDYAAECILLSKVGGGYVFIHRLLLEYFASLGPFLFSPERGV